MPRPIVRLSVFALLAAFSATSHAEAQNDIRRISLVEAPYLRIGSAAGAPETTFAGVSGAFLLDDNQVVVADGGNHVIHFFDLTGRHTHSHGREGSGPGEFRVIQWLGLCGDDTLVAGDPLLGRLSILDSRGRFQGSEVLPAWILFNRFVGCDDSGNLYTVMNEPQEVGPPDKVTRVAGVIARFSRGNDIREDVMKLGGTDWYFASQPAGFGPLPLGARAYAAVGGGYLFGAQSDDSDIHVIDLRTGRQTSFPHEMSRTHASPALRDAALRMILETYPLSATRALVDSVMARAPVPDAAPFFMDVAADRIGNVWLREPSAGSTTLWHVYGPDGARVATVRMESNLRPTDIGERHLVALETDALDVQYIRVYRFAEPLLPEAND